MRLKRQVRAKSDEGHFIGLRPKILFAATTSDACQKFEAAGIVLVPSLGSSL